MRTTDASGSRSWGDDPATPAALGAAAQVFVDDLDALEVSLDDEHHLVQVLRLRLGETVVVSDGAGRWRPCRFTGPAPHGAARSPVLEADGPTVTAGRAEPEVTVAFVPVKGERPEWVVQKLTEAGVDRIIVLGSLRAVVRWEGERRDRALERLRRVAREAAAQSRRPWLPELAALTGLDALSERLAPVPLALAQLGGAPPSIGAPAVAVGPEGGWDPSEAQGRPLVGLGPTVLRAETAAVAAGLLLCALRQGLVGPAPGPGGPPPGPAPPSR
ncbi:MAG TPA: RsmE family RNA methyltransferase [Acidimicrobiales bacterium]